MTKIIYKNFIDNYQDFPRKGINFKDILPILQKPDIFEQLIIDMCEFEVFSMADAIIAIDARGFTFGTGIALNLKKPLVLARKKGKLPGETISFDYDLEYGQNSLEINKNSIKDYSTFVIVDDLLATGGTVECVSNLLYSQNKKVSGLAVFVELENLKGRSKLDFKTESILKL